MPVEQTGLESFRERLERLQRDIDEHKRHMRDAEEEAEAIREENRLQRERGVRTSRDGASPRSYPPPGRDAE